MTTTHINYREELLQLREELADLGRPLREPELLREITEKLIRLLILFAPKPIAPPPTGRLNDAELEDMKARAQHLDYAGRENILRLLYEVARQRTALQGIVKAFEENRLGELITIARNELER